MSNVSREVEKGFHRGGEEVEKATDSVKESLGSTSKSADAAKETAHAAENRMAETVHKAEDQAKKSSNEPTEKEPTVGGGSESGSGIGSVTGQSKTGL